MSVALASSRICQRCNHDVIHHALMPQGHCTIVLSSYPEITCLCTAFVFASTTLATQRPGGA